MNILNQKSVVLYAGECIQNAALDPQSGSVLFAGVDTIADPGMAQKGAFLLPAGQNTPRRVYEGDISRVSWLDTGQVFVAQTYDGETVGIRLDGSLAFNIKSPTDGSLTFNPQGAIVWSSAIKQTGVWVQLPGQAAQQIFDQPSSYPRWSPTQGELLLFTSGADLYAARAPDFQLVKMDSTGADVYDMAWVQGNTP